MNNQLTPDNAPGWLRKMWYRRKMLNAKGSVWIEGTQANLAVLDYLEAKGFLFMGPKECQ